MKKRKKHILEAGLELYNTLGITNVSQRTISDFLKISPGNLTYHYKKKEDIYRVLYFEFVGQVQEKTRLFLNGKRDLKSFANLIEEWFFYIYKYRFIFLDFSTIIRTDPTIKENYLALVEVRKSIFLKTVNELINQKSMRPQEVPHEYELLYKRLHIVSDFFLNANVMDRKIEKLNHTEHKELFFYALFPYLTTKGKKEFLKLFAL